MKLFSRSKRKPILPLVAFLVILVLAPAAYLLSRFPRQTEAAWWDESWQYRKAISIPSHTTTENNVYVTVPAFDATDTTKFQADCGDLRFTKQNGELLPYYVVDCDSTANVHVQFDTLPAGASTYYLYYGNPSAPNGTEAADFATAASGLGSQTAGSEEKSAGPVAYWKFDDASGTSAQDATANNNDGTLSGSTLPVWRAEDMCISGKCLYYNGTTAYTTIPDPSNGSLDFGTGDFSISGWFKTSDATASNRDIVGNNWAASTSIEIRLDTTHKLNFLGLNGGTGINTTTTGTYNDGKWHFYTVVKDTSNTTAYIYIDGQSVKTASFTNSSLSPNQAWSIGGRNNWSISNTDQFFPGFIDDVKIYNYARSAAQVKADYVARGTSKGTSVGLGGPSAGSGQLSNGLVGYWKTDEASWNGTAGEVIDSSGNGNNGQSKPTGPWTGPTTASGKFGNAGLFDDVDDSVSVPNSLSLDPGAGDVSVSVWVKPNTLVGSQTGIVKYVNGNTYYILEHQDNDTLALEFRDGTCSSVSFGTTTTLTAGVWNHIVLVIDRDARAWIYINGVLGGNSTNATTCLASMTGGVVTLGRHVSTLDGYIDDVRIYNRALSPAEVSQLYNWAPGPVGYWNFDEGSGGNIQDRSGNGYMGTWVGSGSHWTAGKFGKAGSLDGSTDYVTVANFPASSTSAGEQGTVTAWVKVSSMPNAKGVVAFSGNKPLLYFGSDGFQAYNADANDYSCNVASSNIPTNKYNHVAWIWDNNTLKIYVNGIVKCSDASWETTFNRAQNILYLGSYSGGGASLTGQLDDVKIYNYARTQKQIVEDMNAGHPAPGSPVGSQLNYWKMDEGYSTTINDTGTGDKDLTFAASTADPSWTNSGKFGKAVYFDGDDKATHSSYAYTLTGLTASAWIKGDTNDQSPYARIFDKWFPGFIMAVTSGNNFRVYLWDDAEDSLTGTSNIDDGNWHYVAFTVDTSTGLFKIYVDGKQEGSKTSTITSSIITSGTINLGGGAVPFKGWIDEVKIYNSALTSDEIKLDMNRGSAQVLGALGDNSSYAAGASNQQYCVPGDSTSCAAPVGEWNFEEKSGQTANDTSGNANSLTLGSSGSADTNDPVWSIGKFGAGLQFDGVDNYATVADSTTLRTTSDWTREIWVKSTTASGGDGSLHDFWTQRTTTNKFLLRVNNSDGAWVIFYQSTGAGFSSLTATRTANAWQHLAVTKSGTNLTVYVDGKLATSATNAENFANDSHQIFFGSSAGPSQYFPGSLDQPRIYNYARTPAQIAWDYNRGAPVGHWKFDECQGTTANDSSGNRNSGTITIGASGEDTVGTCTTSSTAWGSGATGKFNSSLNFDGADDWLDIGSSFTDSIENSGTISTWAYRNSNTGGIFARSTGGNWVDERLVIYLRSDNNTWGWAFANGSSYQTAILSINDFPAGQWVHIVLTWNGSTAVTYVNGRRLDSRAQTVTPEITSVATWIGKTQGLAGQYFSGQIDDVRIYNYALTATQIKQLYNGGAAIKFGPSTGSP